MKMTTRIAFNNMKYYKSRNILIGIAVILTTMLLLVVPLVGRGMIKLQFAVTDRLYPAWHALYRNVDEETVRLRSHIEAVKKELAVGGSIGRKLDFIAQEMNREANTILSKSSDLAVSDTGIELKTSIEKVREQIQNIE